VGADLNLLRSTPSEQGDHGRYDYRYDWLWPGLSLRMGVLPRQRSEE
jgi:hypothetical protein